MEIIIPKHYKIPREFVERSAVIGNGVEIIIPNPHNPPGNWLKAPLRMETVWNSWFQNTTKSPRGKQKLCPPKHNKHPEGKN